MTKKWTESELATLVEHYPSCGKAWCVQALGKKESQIRSKASNLGLRQDRNSEFFKDWQSRAAASKVGKKRPDQADVMKALHKAGVLNSPEHRAKSAEVLRAWRANNPHPKGMLGKAMTLDVRLHLSDKRMEAWKSITDDQIQKRTRKAAETRKANGTDYPPRKNVTWKGGWRVIGGKRKYYRSRWEANYARVLEWMKQKGEVLEWAHESETFWFEGIKRGCVSYLPDFRVKYCDSKVEYHEVKGWMDDRSKTKIKRMAKYHPSVVLRVIDGKAYKTLTKQMAGLIHDWE